MARATWAQRPPCGSPWVLKYPSCHQMITQTIPETIEGFQKQSKVEKILGATKQPIQRENGLLLTGGGRPGVPGVWTWEPPMGEGVHIHGKSCSGPRSKSKHSGRNTKRSFDPTPPHPCPHPPQNGVPGCWGDRGVKIEKFIGGSFLSKNDDSTRCLIPYLGVCYANDPEKGGGGVCNACTCA